MVPGVFFMPVIIILMFKLRRSTLQKSKPRLPLFYRCLSVMLAYMMLISPACLQSLAEGADLYSELDSRYWAEGDTTIEYDYDGNGSLVSKITKATGIEVERTIYEYNLQNRLKIVKTSYDGGTNWDSITEYKYDSDGNRVQKTVDGVTTNYLVDTLNHTGYSQVFVEDGGTYQTSYIIGDDVLAQATGTGQTDIQYLLYDGHNSTRQLADSTGNLITNESYSYDAYGVMLGSNPTSPAGTNLLYTGEWFDTNSQHYYLRERWYDPLNGRFSSIDPFAGNHQDPQSFHKYLYTHCNPINAIDPSGLYNLFFAKLGKIVHRELAIMYKNEHPGHDVLTNYYTIPGTVPALKPDIMDYTLKQIAEIKPLNTREIAKGIGKLIAYLGASNTLGLYGGGWRASTWNVGFRIVPILEDPEWTAVTVGNWKGLILYERYRIKKDELEMILLSGLGCALLTKLKALIDSLGDTANKRAETLDGLVYAIGQQLNTAIALGKAKSKARTVPVMVTGMLMGYITIGTMISLRPVPI